MKADGEHGLNEGTAVNPVHDFKGQVVCSPGATFVQASRSRYGGFTAH